MHLRRTGLLAIALSFAAASVLGAAHISTVVQIHARDYRSYGCKVDLGSDDVDHILTTAHSVRDNDAMGLGNGSVVDPGQRWVFHRRVFVVHSGRRLPAKILKVAKHGDVALLSTERTDLPASPLLEHGRVSGTLVNPEKRVPFRFLKDVRYESYYLGGSTYFGDSGSPVLTDDGGLVAIYTGGVGREKVATNAHKIRQALGLNDVVASKPSERFPSFDIHAPTEELAIRIGERAEQVRQQFAKEWFGRELPEYEPDCTIRVIYRKGNGGSTRFNKHDGVAGRFRMVIQGTGEGLFSVLDHEVMHTVLHSIVPGEIPRWIDEGVAGLVESDAEQRVMHRRLADLNRYIPISEIFGMGEYPPGETMLFYSQGHSLAKFLLQHGDKRQFGEFMLDGSREGWQRSLGKHYRYSVNELEVAWRGWLRAGLPRNQEVGRCQFIGGRWVCEPLQTRSVRPRIQGPRNPTVTIPPVPQDPPSEVREGPRGAEGPVGPEGPQGEPGKDGKDAVVDYQKIVAAVVDELGPKLEPPDIDELTDRVIAKLPPMHFVVETQDGRSKPKSKRLGETLTIHHYAIDIDEIAGKVAEQLDGR